MDPFDLRKWSGFSSAGGSLNGSTIVDQIAVDSRRIESPHAVFVALKGEKVDGHSFVEEAARAGAKFAVVSKEWLPPSSLPSTIELLRVSQPLTAFQEMAQAYREQLPASVIGITGSFGKTMVKDFLYALLSKKKCVGISPESFNSQIGVTLSLFTIKKEHEIAVIEAAISQKGEMDLLAKMIQPNHTLLTPIGKKHLATLEDIPTLVNETFKLLNSTASGGWILLPQDPHIQQQHLDFVSPHFFWNQQYLHLPHAKLSSSHSYSTYEIFFPDGSRYEGSIANGHAYFLNLLNMGTKVAWLMGLSSTQIISTLENYQLQPMRTEIWKSSLGSTFVNDTYCSDPQSVDLSLTYFNQGSANNRRLFVFGGMRSQLPSMQNEYRRIGKALSQSHIRYLLLVGNKPFKPLIDEMQKHSHESEIIAFDKYEEAFSYLQNHLKAEDLVIFKGENKIPLDQLTEVFNDSIANNQCIINFAAIQANISLIRKILPSHTRLMVIVKALAYGTDDVRMAKFLSSCNVDILGVSYIDEGVALKRAGVQQAIFSINAAPYEIPKVIKWELEVGVSDREFILTLANEAERYKKKIKVHLHVNTGMGRFGCRSEDAYALAVLIRSLPSLELEGLMTHFACAENPQDDEFTRQQIQLFDEVIERLKEGGIDVKWKHAANSSASLRFHLPQYNMVRLGLAVYGLYSSDAVKDSLDLRLSLSLTSRIVGINLCKRGETVSYGRTYRIESECQKIAVLPIGYFDGIHRHYSGKAHVLVRGQKAPIVGNICMDYLMIDVTHISDVVVGDKVLIFGEDEFGYYLSPEEFAINGNSIVHELVTCLGPRIQRIFVYEEGNQIR